MKNLTVIVLVMFGFTLNAQYALKPNMAVRQTNVYGYSFQANQFKEINLRLNEQPKTNIWVERAVPIFMFTMATGIAGIWTANIAGDKLDVEGNFFQWRDEVGQLYWPHVTSEYLIAGALVTGGVGLIKQKDWAVSFSLVSLGALFNTSLNSLGWAFAEKERYSNAAPMLMGLVGSTISVSILINHNRRNKQVVKP